MTTETVILLQSYCGLSDFTLEFQCSGEEIHEAEAIMDGLLTNDMIRRHRASSYRRQWFRVKPGDTIQMFRRDDAGRRNVVYIVPEHLPDPPQNPDRFIWNTDLERYLDEHCALQSEEKEVF